MQLEVLCLSWSCEFASCLVWIELQGEQCFYATDNSDGQSWTNHSFWMNPLCDSGVTSCIRVWFVHIFMTAYAQQNDSGGELINYIPCTYDSTVQNSAIGNGIDLSVSPSPRTQTSQWQSSISCTRSGTRTSLGFSTIEKHWKIRSSHWFYGVYASKMIKRCAWGTCNTDSRYPERIGNIINFITFPES